jgi:two-component system NtrC family sensor kinase
VVFLFAVGIAAALLINMYQVEEKLRVLEIVNDFVIEIQQARRFEKNFLPLRDQLKRRAGKRLQGQGRL